MTRKETENGRKHLWNLELMCVSEGYSLEGKDGWGWGRKQFIYCRNSAKEESCHGCHGNQNIHYFLNLPIPITGLIPPMLLYASC